MTLQLHYSTLRYTTLHSTALHDTTPTSTTTTTTTLLHTTLHQTTLHYTTLQYITLDALHTLITAHHNYNSTILQLQLQLHYTTLLPAVVCVCEVTDQVTTATIVTTPNCKIPTTFQSISGFALPSVIHNHQHYRVPILKLPPPPCAILLVYTHVRIFYNVEYVHISSIYHHISAFNSLLIATSWRCFRPHLERLTCCPPILGAVSRAKQAWFHGSGRWTGDTKHPLRSLKIHVFVQETAHQISLNMRKTTKIPWLIIVFAYSE